jgi:hypothetical protein
MQQRATGPFKLSYCRAGFPERAKPCFRVRIVLHLILYKRKSISTDPENRDWNLLERPDADLARGDTVLHDRVHVQ